MMHLKEGTSLQGGRYRIEKVLGQGGFGITYLGIQVGLNRQVAIKEFFMKEYCNREEETSHVSVPSVGSKELVKRFRQKFVKEAQTISELENHHIVRIHDVFEENGTAYYVMEYLPGGDLRSRIPKGGMSETEALSYIRQIADALMYVHERNILHLDIKPSNVLFRSNREAVLVDFGLSKHYDETSGDQTSSTPLGLSEGYAPTEQYECGGVSSFSPATDIYSLGATFYCLLQGIRPPKASIVLNEGLPALPSHISASTRKAIETAMQSRRKDRPQSVEAFLSLLDALVENNDEETILDIVSSEPTLLVADLKPSPRKWVIPFVLCLLTAFCVFGLGKCIGPKGGGSEDNDSLFTDTLVHVDTVPVIPVEDDRPKVDKEEKGDPDFVIDLSKESSELSKKPSKKAVFTTDTGTINGHEYVDLGLSVKWATMNVGADSPGDYGDYFAWGEVHPKSKYMEKTSKTMKKDMSNISGNSQYDAARYHWGGSWRLPTKKELEELKEKCRWIWSKENGHEGCTVVGPNGNRIFLPATGLREGASAYSVGRIGYYRSGSPGESNSQRAYSLHFHDGDRGVSWGYRLYGLSVRPVSD